MQGGEKVKSEKKPLWQIWLCLLLGSNCSFFPFWSLPFTKLYRSSHSYQITSIALKKIAYSVPFASPGMASPCLRLGNHRPRCGCPCHQRFDNECIAMYGISCTGTARVQMTPPLRSLYKAHLEKRRQGMKILDSSGFLRCTARVRSTRLYVNKIV